ncbi:MAG: 7-carboxy-7-deazaguanine synthase QueE [Phocaeicola sp.]|nr:7-carboxy-7-deazaguanine synthase QueE [Phocaeicola sp.]
MKINEIFYSVQGEGFHAGTPAVFIRFSGCNLKCPFCDTNHFTGNEMSVSDIIEEITKYPARLIIITGGEPSLFLTDELVNKLHDKGKYVAVETNGTNKLPSSVDWVTLSPKDNFVKNAVPVNQRYDEVKVVFDGNQNVDKYLSIPAKQYYLQPCDTGNETLNKEIINKTLEHCMKEGKWRISIQTHKILNVR